MPLNELEGACLERHRRGAPPPPIGADAGATEWMRFGLRLALSSGAAIREHRRIVGRDDVAHKPDGSPATEVEHVVEVQLRRWLSGAAGVQVVGEETGGLLPEEGIAVAIDPIDGTWAFLGETEQYATSLAVFRDQVATLAVISSPVTGEIAYATPDDARLVRLPLFGEAADAHSLRDHHPVTTSSPLVNLHPSRAGADAVAKLYESWKEGRISMVRSPGGSPAWALVEAARGHFAYVNLWSKIAAMPYDLAAGVLVVRAAGGDVVDLRGKPIEPLGHQGPFVAAIDQASRDTVVGLVAHEVQG